MKNISKSKLVIRAVVAKSKNLVSLLSFIALALPLLAIQKSEKVYLILSVDGKHQWGILWPALFLQVSLRLRIE